GRHRVADEVHVVAAAREREAELRRDDAGAAEGGIAGDADLQISRFPYAAITSSIRGGCFVMNASPYAALISAPKCTPRPSIMFRNFGSLMNVFGSFDFGS